MLDQDVHHVPVKRDGRIVGVVTDKDLLPRQARGPLPASGADQERATVGGARGVHARGGRDREVLFANDVEPLRIARMITSLNDALTTKLLCIAEDELGSPPCPYAWLALGSEGRMEQVLVTDQDNALVYRDGTTSALVLIYVSPTIQVDVLGNEDVPLSLKNPALISMPLAFAHGIVVSLLTPERESEERFLEAERQIPRRRRDAHARPHRV